MTAEKTTQPKNFIISEELLINTLRYVLESTSTMPVKVSTELVMKLRNLEVVVPPEEKPLAGNTKTLKKK